MRSPLPLFPVTTVGSWPRSEGLLRAQRKKLRGELSAAEFDKLADDEVITFLRLQEEVGVDLVTDGEQRRENFYSFAAEKLEGVQLMSLADMLDVVEDRAGFEKILQTLDVPAFSIYNPTCVGKLSRKSPLAADEVRFVKANSAKAVKATLPGPYLLTRAMYVQEVTRQHYATKEELGEDVVRVLRDEVAELIEAGADFIQIDEPVLTELVFTQGQTRTFMCAALAARKDPAEELEFAADLINRVFAGFSGVRTGMHVCRGNWSRDETTLLSGSYAPLRDTFSKLNVDQLVLEYATPRAGDMVPLSGKELGLGVVNPRTGQVESAEEIAAKVRAALEVFEPERIFLNPDCGFGTFSARPMNDRETAKRKLEAMVAAANDLRLGISTAK